MNKQVRKAVARIHRKYSHYTRVDILSNIICSIIKKHLLVKKTYPLRILDVGCGDMQISRSLTKRLASYDVSVSGIDIFEPNPESLESCLNSYSKFNGRDIPYDNDSFELAIFCDVLHHDMENANTLIEEAKRVSRYILIKDHLESGQISRKILQLMDIVGNWGYGVRIPKRYFDSQSMDKFINMNQLRLVERLNNIELYNHIPGLRYIAKSEYQILLLLQR